MSESAEPWLTDLLDAAPVPAALVDGRGRIHERNAAFAELFGDISKIDAVTPEGASRVLATALAQRSPAGPLSVQLKDAAGRLRTLMLSVAPLGPNGDGSVLFADADRRGDSDADRQRLLERLMSAEERCRSYFDVAPVGMFEADADSGRLLAVNEAMSNLTGYSARELVGMRLRHITHPLYRDRDWAELTRARRDGSTFRIGETGWLTRQGDTAWVRIEGNLVAARDGQHLMAVVQDVSEQHRHQERMDQIMRDRDSFLAMLGHQLRNRLAAITTATHLLGLVDTDDPRLERAREIIQRQSASMADFLGSLQDLVRLAAGKLRLVHEPLDLTKLADEVAEEWRPRVEREGLRLALVLPSEPAWISADRGRIVEMLGNLLSNAVKYTQAPGTITIHLETEGDRVRIGVRDTGRTIEPSRRETIFEPFRNISRNIDRAANGLGLGLPLARGLAELHGGQLVVEDTEDEGNDLVATLPLREPPSSARGGRPSRVEGRQRVLLVEDDLDTAEPLRELLTMAGHEVALTTEGEEALQLAREMEPNVVLCDIALKGKQNGYDVARELRRSGRPMQLVAITGYSRPEDRDRAYEAGFDRFLIKPITLEELRDLLGRPEPAPAKTQPA